MGKVTTAMVTTVVFVDKPNNDPNMPIIREKKEITMSFTMDSTLEEIREAVFAKKGQHVIQVVFENKDEPLVTPIITPVR